MLDVFILALLTFAFLFALYRWRKNSRRSVGPLVGSGALLVGFAVWWYLLGPLVTG